MSKISKINIIYLLPELTGAAGGAKVIYNHSLILNNINNKIQSSILHIKKKLTYKLELSISKRVKFFNKNLSGWDGKKMKISTNFLPDKSWYDKNIKSAKNLNFTKNKDFLIIPEILAHFAEDLELKKKKIKYGIFVQGSFHMQSTENFDKLKSSYENADIILSTSIYSLNFIKGLFPKCKNKVFKINLSIDNKKKVYQKKNYITCMPRKLPAHFNLLKLYLKNKLPKNWKLESLENINSDELNYKLSRSKIFLSFSHFEGFGLPPLEAALAGNKVIGYNGGGGKEYWKKPIFNEIKYGEIKEFGNTIIKEIENYNKNWIKITNKQRIKLSIKYSSKSEIKSLTNLSNKISNLF